MNKTKLLCAALSVLTVAASNNIFAGNRAGAGYVSIGDGYYFFASKRNLKNANVPSVRLGYDFDNSWAAQFGATLINTDPKGNGSDRRSVHGFDYSVDGIYRTMPIGNFEPYVFAGLGVLGLSPNGNDPVNQAHAQVGVGSQYFFSESIALGLDAKDVYVFSGGKNDMQLTATVNFLFGGNSHPVVTPEKSVWKGEKK